VSVTPRYDAGYAYGRAVEGVPFLPENDTLRLKDIARLMKIYSGALGIRKVRLTGGEPLLRKGIIRFINDLKTGSGIEKVTLSTNGVMLKRMIPELRSSGLDRINVSLDTLRPDRLEKISGYDIHDRVMSAINEVVENNIWPLKISVVLMRGFNHDEALDFADMAYAMPVEIRFIQMMPATTNEDDGDMYTPYYAFEIERDIRKKYNLVPSRRIKNGGPAFVYRIDGGRGSVGFVSPMGKHNCSTCSRLRLTSGGKLRACLFDDYETDLRPGFVNGENDGWFLEKFYETMRTKSKRYELRSESSPQRESSDSFVHK